MDQNFSKELLVTLPLLLLIEEGLLLAARAQFNLNLPDVSGNGTTLEAGEGGVVSQEVTLQ